MKQKHSWATKPQHALDSRSERCLRGECNFPPPVPLPKLGSPTNLAVNSTEAPPGRTESYWLHKKRPVNSHHQERTRRSMASQSRQASYCHNYSSYGVSDVMESRYRGSTLGDPRAGGGISSLGRGLKGVGVTRESYDLSHYSRDLTSSSLPYSLSTTHRRPLTLSTPIHSSFSSSSSMYHPRSSLTLSRPISPPAIYRPLCTLTRRCCPSSLRADMSNLSLSKESSWIVAGSTRTALRGGDLFPCAGADVTAQKTGPKAGEIGLRNLGNTCFMASIIQCLSHARPLRDLCLERTSCVRSNSLLNEFSLLLRDLWGGNGAGETRTSSVGGAVSPLGLHVEVQHLAPQFSGYRDVCREESRISALFRGRLQSSLTCCTCNHRSLTHEAFWDLALPLPSFTSDCSLHDCLQLFMQEEVLNGTEQPLCERCRQKRRSKKSLMVEKWPAILILYLKRYRNDRNSISSVCRNVSFPLTNLNLSAFSTHSTGPLYSLFAVVRHSGSLNCGHYVATCRHTDKGNWLMFDDCTVVPISATDVVSREAYILFYEQTSSMARL
uniref:Ubiquitin carboxyl-terminal hydrolase n=2 Tax=Eptatretus burgeri TaxID=7764 RepID=A0A8C4N5Y4_EPTBU